jgi:caffeoyl-CoA O-methyltransferase
MIDFIQKEILEYCRSHSSKEEEIFRQLVRDTYATQTNPEMITDIEVGNFLQLIVKISGAKKILEIGMFTGYSSMKFAQAAHGDAQIDTCEIDSNRIALAKKYFKKVPWAKKITVHKGPALKTIEKLQTRYDLIFIDADKENYLNYYKRSMDLIRKGGIIILDNALWGGSVLDPQDKGSKTIAETNDFIRQDKRVFCQLIPIRDGLMLAQVL